MRRRSSATVLVGPSALLREGLTRILSHTDFRVVASVSHTQDIAWASLASFQPILLITNAGDDPYDTAGQIKFFKEQHPGARVAVVASHHCPGAMISAFRAGANAYHAKLANFDVFTKALEPVLLGETVLPPELLSFICDRKGEGELIPLLEHFQEKWNPVFRPKMRQSKNARAVSISGLCETALAERVSGGDKPAATFRSFPAEKSAFCGASPTETRTRISPARLASRKRPSRSTSRRSCARSESTIGRKQRSGPLHNSAVLSLTDHSALATAPTQVRPLLPVASTAQS
jgi:DNA-binding NarL/FixJ family response regulator